MQVPKHIKDAHPHLEKFWPYMELLENESDRGKVLVSTGFIEQQLKEILLAFTVEGSGGEGLLEGANAPLGTFSSRILACYALGLISESEHHDLNLVRKIRNDFAHDIHTNFETASVVSRCSDLLLKVPDDIYPELGRQKIDPLGQFQTCAISLIMNLVNRAFYVSKERCTPAHWPY